jgi:hypothetical protein
VNEEISISVALQVAQRPSVMANSRVLIVRRELMKSEISGDLGVGFIRCLLWRREWKGKAKAKGI